jgi:hypothetical protein
LAMSSAFGLSSRFSCNVAQFRADDFLVDIGALDVSSYQSASVARPLDMHRSSLHCHPAGFSFFKGANVVAGQQLAGAEEGAHGPGWRAGSQ